MRMRACLIAAVLSIAPYSLAKADPIAFGVAFDQLFRVDLGTRQATLIGTAGNYAGVPLALLTGLTYGPGNELYAVAGNRKSLVKIEVASGLARFIGDFSLNGQGQGQFNSFDLSMTYGCDGSFWMTSAITKDIWRVNAQNAAMTLVGSTGRQISGLAIRNGVLFGTGIGSDQGLYTINTQTGAATLVGGLPDTIPWIDPSVGSDGTLWATLSYNPPFDREWSDLGRFDTTTGALTNLGPITGPDSLRFVSMKGLAVAPNSCTPEVPNGPLPAAAALPSQSNWALAALGLMLLAVSAWRFRQRLH
jgi:hypothetical protein